MGEIVKLLARTPNDKRGLVYCYWKFDSFVCDFGGGGRDARCAVFPKTVWSGDMCQKLYYGERERRTCLRTRGKEVHVARI